MIKSVYLLGLIVFLSSITYSSQAQEIKVIKVPELEKVISGNTDQQIKVVNFWATWCKPCIKELPYFVHAQSQFPQVEFIYISIDFSENATKAQQFALKKGLNSQGLYLIDDLDYNSWIDKVSPEWSGAIPATLVVKGDEKYFYEKEFNEGELDVIIKDKLK